MNNTHVFNKKENNLHMKPESCIYSCCSWRVMNSVERELDACMCLCFCVLTPGFLEAHDIDPTHGRHLHHLSHTLVQSCDLWKQNENTEPTVRWTQMDNTYTELPAGPYMHCVLCTLTCSSTGASVGRTILFWMSPTRTVLGGLSCSGEASNT